MTVTMYAATCIFCPLLFVLVGLHPGAATHGTHHLVPSLIAHGPPSTIALVAPLAVVFQRAIDVGLPNARRKIAHVVDSPQGRHNMIVYINPVNIWFGGVEKKKGVDGNCRVLVCRFHEHG